jgi:outer membrane biosynthesis protein TonB
MKNTIRNTLLITTAATALVAGTSLASAQGMNERREAPAAHDQKAPEGKTDQQQGSAPQKSDKVKPAPSAQAPDKVKPAPSAQAPDKAKPAPSAQAPEKPIDSKSQTTGQGGTAQPSQSPNQGAAPSAAARETKSGAPAALSTEQHVKFRETIRGEKVERLTNVAFLITVGEAVPRTVHRYRFPVSVMEYAPQYRGYEYILVGDEILVVDPRTMRIVAVIPA